MRLEEELQKRFAPGSEIVEINGKEVLVIQGNDFFVLADWSTDDPLGLKTKTLVKEMLFKC